MTVNRIKIFLLIGLVPVLFAGCDSDIVFDKNLVIEGKAWNWRQRAVFNAEITDTASLYNVYINARINNDYPYSNLFVILTRKDPGGDSSMHRKELTFFNPDGSPSGMRKGSVLEYRIPVFSGYSFDKAGTYTFGIDQNMRTNTLKGVLDIGLAIEKAGEKF